MCTPQQFLQNWKSFLNWLLFWKFLTFCITYILREIDFGAMGFKIVILLVLEASKLDFL